MAAQLHRLFGQISKVAEESDGSITVYGIASSGARDGAGEIITPEAMKAALPDYNRFPALREMHQPTAAGKVTEVDVDEDGVTRVAAHVVDPLAITKVRAGVYGGFSIGGRVTKRDPNDPTIITGLKLVEISLVDSPCNPDAILSMWKADVMTEFKPQRDDVIAKAKLLAETAGTKRFRDFLFEAAETLTSEHMLKMQEAEDEAIAAGAVDAAAAETAIEKKEKAPKADDGDDAGEDETGADGPDAADAADGDDTDGEEGDGEKDDKEKVAEIDPAAEVVDAVADPATALADALKSASAAIESATKLPEPPAGPFEDLDKAAEALKLIALPEGTDRCAKSLYSVSRFAELLESFAYLQQTAACEEAYEGGEASAVPAKLADAIRALGVILVEMTQEEVGELLNDTLMGGSPIEIVYVGEDFALANEIVDLVKADTDLMEKVAARHPAPASEELEIVVDEIAEKLAETEADRDRLAKALEEAAPQVDTITKAFNETIDGLKSQLTDLEKRFSELDQTPLPPKTAGSAALHLVTKGRDSAGADAEEQPEGAINKEAFDAQMAALPEEERVRILTKVALQQPHLIQVR